MQKSKIKKSIKGKIIGYTTFVITLLVIISILIMMFSMKSLTNTILLDTLQPMVKESAKTVEENIHILANRMMSMAEDARITKKTQNYEQDCNMVLNEAKEMYELYGIALYNKDGSLFLGNGDVANDIKNDKIYEYLQSTDNLSFNDSTLFNNKLGITVAMPIKINKETEYYLLAVYQYDALNDVLSNINIGQSGQPIVIDSTGQIVGHKKEDYIKSCKNVFDNCTDSEKEVYNRIIKGETGSAEAIIDNENNFIAFAPIGGTHWSLIVEVPKSDYLYFADRAIITVILVATILLFIALLVIYRLSKSISISVNKATKRIVELAEGDLKTNVEVVYSKDEMELLTSSLQDTVSSVNYYISEIKRVLADISEGNFDINISGEYKGDFVLIKKSLSNIVNSLNFTMNTIKELAGRLSLTAEGLNDEFERLHIASITQNDSAEKLVNEVEAVEKKLIDVSINSENTKERVVEIAKKIEQGNDRMKSLSDTMNEISLKADEITNISKIIENIAFQTEILSLNASVEASRAGDYGKGFAVVANEVKKLSNESTVAAKNSTKMIKEIYETISKGSELMKETALSLEEISKLSKIIEEITDELEKTVDIQKNSLVNMADNIGNISNIADENLQNSESAKKISSEIADEANKLYDVIGKFNLKEGGK